jgi:RNA polymerase sigma-70 factor (ECF subfamily)
LAIDHFRKQKRNPEIVLEDGSSLFNSLSFSEDSTESIQIQTDTHTKLKLLIETLPQSQREVLIMRHYADLSFKEIAETTGVSINTALGRMRYALINLRKLMEESNIAYDKNNYSS